MNPPGRLQALIARHILEDNNERQLIHEHESAPAAKRSSDAASGPRSEHLRKHYRRKDNESA